MIEWEYYKKRRAIRLDYIIRKHDIETYEQIISFFEKKGVAAPPEEEFKIAHKVAMPKIETPKKNTSVKKPAQAKTTKAAPKRRGRPRKTKVK